MSDLKSSYSIAVIGAGKIGQAVGQLWLAAGHEVCFAARNPQKLNALVTTLGPWASTKSIPQAAAAAEIIFLAVPYEAVDELIPTLTSSASGKLVIDATNPFALSDEGHIVSSLGSGQTAGSRMASLLPESTVVRAFSHVMDELLVSRGTTQAGLWAMAIAGDDSAAKTLASKLVDDAGFVAVDIGTLAESSALDPGGSIFPHMFTAADMRAVLG